MKQAVTLLFCIAILTSACSMPGIPPTATPTEPATATSTSTPVPTNTPTEIPTEPPTETPTLTPTPIPTDTPAPTETPTPVPTYAILRGTVNVERVSCRYGPGPSYLYLYGLIQGANQEVLGRTDSGDWVLTKARGDNKSCWVKGQYLTLNGEFSSLEVVYPDKYAIPQSNQGYRPPWDVAAVRSGNQVVISWKSEALRPGDEEDANMVIYIVETWTCQNGEFVFTSIGTSLAQATVTDEPGCARASWGRVYFQEKHGYAGPSLIPWP